MKTEAYWLEAAEDFRRFREGEINKEVLLEKYPEFEIREGWCCYSHIKEAIEVTIPEDCPTTIIPKLVQAMYENSFDVNRIAYKIRVAYQPVWETLPQKGKLQDICKEKESVVFRISLQGAYWRSNLEPCIDIRYCIREGSHGDEDGYGVEDDTWLVALINEDGTWLHEWYIED